MPLSSEKHWKTLRKDVLGLFLKSGAWQRESVSAYIGVQTKVATS